MAARDYFNSRGGRNQQNYTMAKISTLLPGTCTHQRFPNWRIAVR